MLDEQIKKLRKRLGYTQEEFARKLGLTHSTVSGWESGERRPDADMINKMSNIFQVSLDFLFGKEELADEEKFVGGNINLILQEKNMTFIELAKAISKEDFEIKAKDIKRYASGKEEPEFLFVHALAEFAEIDSDILYKQNSLESLKKSRQKSLEPDITSIDNRILRDNDIEVEEFKDLMQPDNINYLKVAIKMKKEKINIISLLEKFFKI